MKCIGFIGLFLLMLGGLVAEDFRLWTTISGGHFEARVLEARGPYVTLANREGRVIDFRIGDLRPSDQDYIRYWIQERRAVAAEASPVKVERSAFTELVYRELVHVKGRRLARIKPSPTDRPQYFAFYRSALWCPPCRKFTPKLVDFYEKQKRNGASFEMIFVSSDRDEESMEEYMVDYNMSWPAFSLGKNRGLVTANGNGIPNLIVTDADGNKLLDSYNEDGSYIGPTRVLEEFRALLAE